MYCAQCGNEIESQARFCSRCGTPANRVQVQALAKTQDWELHVKILSGLFIAASILIGLLGIVVVFAGHMIGRIPMFWPPNVPFAMPALVGSLSAVIGLGIFS